MKYNRIFLSHDATDKDWDKEEEMILLGPNFDVTVGRLYEGGRIKNREIKGIIQKGVSNKNIHIDKEEVNDNWLHSMRGN